MGRPELVMRLLVRSRMRSPASRSTSPGTTSSRHLFWFSAKSAAMTNHL